MKFFKKSKLATACQISLLSSVSLMALNSTVYAAEDITEIQGEEEAEVIEVYGLRASEQKSRDMKKNSVGVVDAIMAEDIGKMPDANIAEALQRITGVSITRNNGEGSQVSVRGMGPALNRISVNGKTLTSSGDDQAVGLESFSSGLLEKVEVFKTPSASMVEGSLGGSINLQTKRAMDVKEQVISFTAGAEYAENVAKVSPSFQLNYIDHFADRTYGFSGGINYEKRDLRTDNMQIDGYFLPTRLDGLNSREKAWLGTLNEDLTLPELINGENNPNRFLNGDDLGQYGAARPKSIKYKYTDSVRERIGGSATFEMRPNDSTDIVLDFTYTSTETEVVSHQFSANMTKDFDASSMLLNHNNTVLAGNAYNLIPALDADGNPNPNAGLPNTASGGIGKGSTTDNWNTKTKDTFVGGLEISKNFDTMNVTGAIGYSATKLDTPEAFRFAYSSAYDSPETTPFFAFDTRRGDVPSIIQHGDKNIDMLDEDFYKVNAVTSFNDMTDDNEIAALIDVDYDVDLWIVNMLEFGFRATNRVKDRAASDGRFQDAPGYNWSQSVGDVAADFPVDDFLQNASGNTITSWPVADLDLALADFGITKEELQSLPQTALDPSKAYIITDNTLASYVQANFTSEDDALGGNFGVRVVYTDSEREGSAEEGVDTSGQKIYSPTFQQSDYTQILPSFSLRYSINDDNILRLAGGRVMARPSLAQVSSKTKVSQANNTVKTGNPDLLPYIVDQVDISAETYFGDLGMVSLGLFYKDIQNYVQKTSREGIWPEAPLNCLTADNDEVPQNDKGCQIFTINQPMNGPSSKVKGAEVNFYRDLNFLPSFLTDLSFKFNYTYSDSESKVINPETGDELVGVVLPLEGMSEHTANTMLAYEGKGGFAIRLSHNYRSEYMNQAFGLQANTEYVDAYGQFDLSASYKINEHLGLSLQGINITSEVPQSYYDQSARWEQIGSTERAKNYNSSGRRYRITLKGKF